MRIIKKFGVLFLATIGLISCNNDDTSFAFQDISAPTDLSAVFDIAQDDSGEVSVSPTGTGVSVFEVYFGDVDSETPTEVAPGETLEHTYTEEGEFTLRVVGIGATGLTSELGRIVMISFTPPSDLVVDVTISDTDPFEVVVAPTATDATVFDILFGDEDEDAVPTTIMSGETSSHIYAEAGDFIISVVARGASSTTITETEEVSILGDSTPVLLPLDFESISTNYAWSGFGGANPTAPVQNPDPSGINTSANVLEIVKTDGAQVWAGASLSLAVPIDFENGTTINLKVWSPRAGTPILFKIEDTSSEPDVNGNPSVFIEIPMSTTVAMAWEELTYNLTSDGAFSTAIPYDRVIIFPDFGTAGSDETFYFDDIEHLTDGSVSTFDSGLLINGDFENGSEAWLVGVDDSSSVNVVTEGDNSFYSVNVESAGNSFDVNMSQKLEIVQGETYSLTFDAWSDTERPIIAGIGLSGGDFSNNSETIDINTTRTTYTLELIATNFGAPDARVLFDLGAAVGLVNIDNVSLVLGGPFDSGLLVNGDFENGSESWLVGVDDSSSVNVVTEGDNSFYSANVESAGNSFDVNMSQKLEIVQGETYTLTFDAWSDTERPIVAGIGLSGGDFSNNSETVNINTVRTTYTLVLTATNFGAMDARVLFDLGAAVGMVNIDNVSLAL